MALKKGIDDYNTIIWDWNGTLLNDVWLCVEIVNELLVNHNQLRLDETSYREVFGFPITSYYKKIGIDFKKESFELLTKKFMANYDEKVKQCELHKRAVDVLDKFNDNKLNQFMLTAAHKESVLELLEHYSLKDYFTGIEGLDNHKAESKINRGRELIKKNKINTKETVLIGDTIHDLEVAIEIGVDCILIANGHQSKKRLEAKTQSNLRILDKIEELIS